jgi:hypothetical protein
MRVGATPFLSISFDQQSNGGMVRRQIEMENPRIPNRRVIVRFLLRVVVTDPKLIGNFEYRGFVFSVQHGLKFFGFLEPLENISKFPYGFLFFRLGQMAVSPFCNGIPNLTVDILLVERDDLGVQNVLETFRAHRQYGSVLG